MTSQKKPEIKVNLELPGTDYQRALKSALRILTGRDYSRYELVQKLKQRGFPPDIIEKVVLECERLDYVDDNRTSRVYIRKLIRKGYGEKRIRIELKKKGLHGQPVQGVIAQMISDIDELEVAGRIFKKNIKRFEREIDPRKRKNKIYRFLLARGFSAETIRKLIKSE